MIEAIASDPNTPRSKTGLDTPGYRSQWVTDLMVDYDPRIGKPYAFMSSSFEKTYPLVIWALKFHMADELFDLPQAGLKAVPLHEAFSWAYTHFIRQTEKVTHLQKRPSPPNRCASPNMYEGGSDGGFSPLVHVGRGGLGG